MAFRKHSRNLETRWIVAPKQEKVFGFLRNYRTEQEAIDWVNYLISRKEFNSPNELFIIKETTAWPIFEKKGQILAEEIAYKYRKNSLQS